MKPTRIEPTWAGEVGAILAAGPSVRGLDLSPLDRCKVVAINHAWRLYPKAHTALGGDLRFFRTQTKEDWDAFPGKEIICLSPEAWKQTAVSSDPRTIHIDRGRVTGLEEDRTKVSGRQTCVTQCMSYLVHRGVKAIILVGIDLQPGPNGERYADRDELATRDNIRWYEKMFQNFRGFVRPLHERGINVYNASERSQLTYLWGYTPLFRAVEWETR